MFGFTRRKGRPTDRQILIHDERPTFVYAIGDIHGCYRQLLALEEQIAEHAVEHGQDYLIVYLGDLIDRGPNAFDVVEHLSAAPHRDHVVLAGNHEIMFGEFLDAPSPRHAWLQYGGVETLASYGLDASRLFESGRAGAKARLTSYLPREHIEFLSALPLGLSLPGLTLVHAGLRPGLPLDRQAAEDMSWLRMPEPAFSEPQPFGLLVHGHTPNVAPIIEPYRICIDTGAFATGVLSAVAIDRQGRSEVLASGIAGNRNDKA